MTIRTMTVQEALNQLKIHRDRIASATTQPFVAAANAKGMVPTLGVQADAFGARAQSNLQSAMALIANYRALKRAINLSNAVTEITVGGRRMTIAEAIDWKKSITFAEALRNKLTMDLTSAQRLVGQHQERVQRDAEQAASNTFGAKENANAKDYESMVEAYLKRNGMTVVDSVNAQSLIDTMTAEIDTFIAEIDLALTVSNVTTQIEIDLA